ncbi:hypothetical protein BJ742DRAFT_738475 [Cladochytrium replicatum]|nr:hypothetical protein BJ742DRAFT_738475 [Cladochytrium replicatum]
MDPSQSSVPFPFAPPPPSKLLLLPDVPPSPRKQPSASPNFPSTPSSNRVDAASSSGLPTPAYLAASKRMRGKGLDEPEAQAKFYLRRPTMQADFENRDVDDDTGSVVKGGSSVYKYTGGRFGSIGDILSAAFNGSDRFNAPQYPISNFDTPVPIRSDASITTVREVRRFAPDPVIAPVAPAAGGGGDRWNSSDHGEMLPPVASLGGGYFGGIGLTAPERRPTQRF